MASLLYIKASPRTERSHSIAVAGQFVSEYRKSHPSDNVLTHDIFSELLPVFDGHTVETKYLIMHGKDRTPEHVNAWKPVEDLIAQFKSADKYLLAVPMWNFSIPYRLKQYIDLIVQPGYTFSYDPEKGYEGLLSNRRVFVAYARGGEYAPGSPAEAFDLQTRYLATVLGFIGIQDVRSVVVEPSLQGGPDMAAERLKQAVSRAQAMAKDF